MGVRHMLFLLLALSIAASWTTNALRSRDSFLMYWQGAQPIWLGPNRSNAPNPNGGGGNAIGFVLQIFRKLLSSIIGGYYASV